MSQNLGPPQLSGRPVAGTALSCLVLSSLTCEFECSISRSIRDSAVHDADVDRGAGDADVGSVAGDADIDSETGHT